jgi:hypothetical protein
VKTFGTERRHSKYRGHGMDDRSCLSVRVIAAAAALTLCSCGTPWGTDTDPTTIACQGYGFYPESREFAECVKFVEARQARRAALTNKPIPQQQAPNVTCKTTGPGTDCQTR